MSIYLQNRDSHAVLRDPPAISLRYVRHPRARYPIQLEFDGFVILETLRHLGPADTTLSKTPQEIPEAIL